MNRLALIMQVVRAAPSAKRWVEQVVAAHLPISRPAATSASARLRECFDAALLRATRIAVVDNIPQPPLHAWSLPAPDDFGTLEARGITLADMILIREDCRHDESLLFHELVHAFQWRRLGINRFLLLYGLQLMEFGYRRSPLERMAYDLQRQFDQSAVPHGLHAVIERRTQEAWVDLARRSWLHWGLCGAASAWPDRSRGRERG